MKIGDKVQLKNGHGPVMVLAGKEFIFSRDVICQWWDGMTGQFRSMVTHRKALKVVE